MRVPSSISLSLTLVLALCACGKDEPKTDTAASASAPTASAAPSAPAPSAPPSASAAAPEPPHDCPSGSTGVGSFAKPCEAKGTDRMMTVKWTKTDDKGPNFSIKNIGKITITWGKINVYFYDKGGKQIDSQDDSETPPKVKHFHTCSGSFFQGVMKPGESATLTFSCVPKKAIPDGTVTIEAEMQMVGFADPTEKKIDFYWRNADLTPAARPKGGVK